MQVGGLPGGAREWEWFTPEVVGRRPAKRTGHAACLLADGKTILVQGGWDPQDDTRAEALMHEDAYLLDTEAWEWTPLPAAATEAAQQGLLQGKALAPSPGLRVGHTAVLARLGAEAEGEVGGEGNDNAKEEARVLVFGGQDKQGVRRDDLLVIKG